MNITKWYKTLKPLHRLMMLFGIIIVMGLFLFLLLGTITPRNEESGLPSLLGRTPGLPSLIGEPPRLPSLLVPVQLVKYPITLEQILCKYVYDYNISNLTMGSTTCYKWNDTVDCLCMTPL